jgi:hypothetical protein
LPLSRLSTADIVREAHRSGIVATISDTTVWRWINADAIRPWQHRTWIFPRDPDFAVKAGRILDLYARQWQGKALQSDEFVISADEKTSIQARIRKHPSLPPRPAQAAKVEHEYARGGAGAYMAALDDTTWACARPSGTLVSLHAYRTRDHLETSGHRTPL